MNRWDRVALAGLGIAAAAGVLATVFAGSLVARDRSVERATARLPASDRAVRAVWYGVPFQSGEAWAALDRLTRTALRPRRA